MFQLLRVVFADHSYKIVCNSLQLFNIVLRVKILHLKRFDKQFILYQARLIELHYCQQQLSCSHSLMFFSRCSNLVRFRLVY